MTLEAYAKKYHGPQTQPCIGLWLIWFKAEKKRIARARQLARYHHRRATDPAFVLRCRENNAKSRNKPAVKGKRDAYFYAYKRRPGWKEKACEQMKQRARTDLHFRLKKTLRGRLWAALDRYPNSRKHGKSADLLGCTVPQWREHLAARFKPGMAWENYGTAWEIDHILPIAKFDLTDPVQQKIAFHFSNTQPLWKGENRSKGDKIHEN